MIDYRRVEEINHKLVEKREQVKDLEREKSVAETRNDKGQVGKVERKMFETFSEVLKLEFDKVKSMTSTSAAHEFEAELNQLLNTGKAMEWQGWYDTLAGPFLKRLEQATRIISGTLERVRT
jgi:uncharacterized protein YPO0396